MPGARDWGAGRVGEESPGREEKWGRLGPGMGAEREGWRRGGPPNWPMGRGGGRERGGAGGGYSGEGEGRAGWCGR